MMSSLSSFTKVPDDELFIYMHSSIKPKTVWISRCDWMLSQMESGGEVSSLQGEPVQQEQQKDYTWQEVQELQIDEKVVNAYVAMKQGDDSVSLGMEEKVENMKKELSKESVVNLKDLEVCKDPESDLDETIRDYAYDYPSDYAYDSVLEKKVDLKVPPVGEWQVSTEM